MNIGGPARQVAFLQKYFNRGEHESHLIFGALDQDEGDFSNLLEGRHNTIYLRSMVRPISILKDSLAVLNVLWWILKNPQIEIMHTHTAKAGMVGRMARLLYFPFAILLFRKRPLSIHTYHGHVFSGYFSKAHETVIKMIERFLWMDTDRIVTLTPKLKDEICGHLQCRGKKVSIIPLGLDLSPYLKVEKSNYFETYFDVQGGIWVGWVGRLVDIKRPDRFINIAKSLIEKTNLPIHFVLVGDGHLRMELEQSVSELNLSDSVHFKGWDNDLASVFSGLDMFFNTSDNEGTPVAVLESISSGVPVAATNVGGTSEVMKGVDETWLFDPEDWGRKLVDWMNFLSTPNRIGEHQRKRIVEAYSEERLGNDLESLYKRMLSK